MVQSRGSNAGDRLSRFVRSIERRPLLLLVFVLWLLCVQRPTFAYLTDALVHLPADYFSFLPPVLGGTYLDQIFGTQVQRLSDAHNTPDAAGGSGNLTFIRNEYSTMSPFNNDTTRLLLEHQSYFGLYDGAGNYVRDLPFEINTESEPRWSRSDPNSLYYHPRNGNQLKQYNVAANVMSVVHTFSEYTAINGLGESDISFDGDRFVLVGDQHDIFVYTLSTNVKGPVFDIAGLGGIDQVQITPDNHVLVGWLANGPNRHNGIEMYDQDMRFVRQIVPAINHYDVMRDINGDEIMVWDNANDPNPVCSNGVVKVRLADASQTCLLSLDWSMALHVSGSDGGWVLVETYDSSDPNPLLPGAWKPYTNEILQLKLDGSEVRRLLHHRSRPFPGNDYNWTPRASVSRDGTKLVYSSDYGLQQLLGYPSDYVDTYMSDGLDSGVLHRTLGVTKTGNGRVTSSPSGIDCGTDCVNAYFNNTAVTLAAIPDTGEEFLGWSGACTGQTGSCHITTDNSKVATASFTVSNSGSSTTGADGTGSERGCFLATAAFGSPLAEEVQTLRTVRDRFLLTSSPGRFLTAVYYRISPPLARVIAAHEWLRRATRITLRPVIWWARLSLDSPATALAVGTVVLSVFPIILFAPRRTRRRDS